MKFSKTKVTIFIFLIIFLFGNILLFSESLLSQNIKKKIPNEYKEFFKTNIFFITNIFKENLKIKSENIKLYQKIYQLEKAKQFTNRYFFPETNFLDLSYFELPVDFANKILHESYGDPVYPFYIDIYKENVIFANKEGSFFYEKIKNLLNRKIENKYINSNLPNSELTDIIIIDGFIYAALVKKNNDGCFQDSLNIYKAKINFSKLYFVKVLGSKYDSTTLEECDKNFSPVGGALAYSKRDNNLYFSGNSFLSDSEKKPDVDKATDFLRTSKFSSIFAFNLTNNQLNVISTGHRNPLGLVVNKNNQIISTEHGPRGGDEINKILPGKNYGWPDVSYGEPYSTRPGSIYYYKKDHKKNGFEEPVFSFIPSIGISRIIEIENAFSKKWQNNYFVSSLKDRSLYRIELSEESDKLKYMERMRVGKRIRDIAYDKNKKVFLLALEDNPSSLGVFFVK